MQAMNSMNLHHQPSKEGSELLYKLLDTFQRVDLAIAVNTKDSAPSLSWEKISAIINNNTDSTAWITINDFAAVFLIYPSLYEVNLTVSGDFEFKASYFSLDALGDIMEGRKVLFRSIYFTEIGVKLIASRKALFDTMRAQPETGTLIDKSVFKKYIRDSTENVTLDKVELTAAVSSVFAGAELLEKRSSASIFLKRLKDNAMTKHNCLKDFSCSAVLSLKPKSLQEMRAEVMDREALKSELQEKNRREQQLRRKVLTVSSTVKALELIQSFLVERRKTTLPKGDVVRRLCEDLRMNPAETNKILTQLVALLPEFYTLVEEDDVSSAKMFKCNNHAKYSAMRTTLVERVAAQTRELEDKIKSIN